MNYLNIIDDILKTEGGYVDHPSDTGGPTNYGITKKVYENYKGREVSIDEMKNMPKEDAITIYSNKYYFEPGISKLKDIFLQSIILDMAVNHGPSRAIKLLQKTINNVTESVIEEDGVLGPNTTKTANYCYFMMARYFTNEICNVREEFYKSIVKRNASQKVFLEGWLNRNNKFWSDIPYDTVYNKNFC